MELFWIGFLVGVAVIPVGVGVALAIVIFVRKGGV